jgi:two-component system phosphate regulon sensor histidine kinase PhoR
LKLAPVDVHGLIEKATANIALQVEAKQGTVSCNLEALHSFINAESVHIENILHNILDNANKYSPEKPLIEVRTSNEQNNLAVKITDHGIGISEDELKKVFDKYYRVPTGNRHDVKGFGLGLSYVKLMMEAHVGNIQIESELGKGTTVTLMFPLFNGEMNG